MLVAFNHEQRDPTIHQDSPFTRGAVEEALRY